MPNHFFVPAVIAVLMYGATASADPVRHVPPANVMAGTAVELVADAPSMTPTIVAHYRTSGTTAFQTIELVRRDTQWVAIVPAVAVAAPGIDYYLVAGGEPVFASAAWPHTMRVSVEADDDRRSRDMVRSGGRRSRIHTSFEWVNYGTRTDAAREQFLDRYYRIDADFSYRLWAYPLEELRVGYTRLLGDTESPDPTDCPTSGNPAPCTTAAGFKVAGWFELGLAPVEGLRIDGRGMVLATSAGFGVGVRGEVRLGDREGSHVAVGAEYMADVGSSGFFRLGWGTVPDYPMAATVEITQLPDVRRDTGVRLVYDIARAIGNGVRLGVRVGYAARNQAIAGFTGGANASVDF